MISIQRYVPKELHLELVAAADSVAERMIAQKWTTWPREHIASLLVVDLMAEHRGDAAAVLAIMRLWWAELTEREVMQ